MFSVESELRAISRVALSGYFIGLHIRQSGAALTFNSYPSAWQERYAEMSYLLRDPVVAWAYVENGRARWSDLTHLDTAGIFADAAAHGLVHGATIATGALSSRSIASVARPDRDFTDAELEKLTAAVHRLHAGVLGEGALTMNQIEALRLVASGDSYAMAAERLGISVSAVKARLVGARSRLAARTIAEAIQRATAQKLL